MEAGVLGSALSRGSTSHWALHGYGLFQTGMATCQLPRLCTSSVPSLILLGFPIFVQLLGNYILIDFTAHLVNIMGEFQFGYTI